MYGSVPVKSLNVHHFEMDTNDASLQPSDMQAGVTAYARGQKITGTGKCFSFASYGAWETNSSDIVPTTINVIHVGSTDYLVRMKAPLGDITHYDFSVAQEVAEVSVDGVVYPITVSVQNGEFIINCEKTIFLELFIGKDEYA